MGEVKKSKRKALQTIVSFVVFTVYNNEQNAVMLLLPTHFQEIPQKTLFALFFIFTAVFAKKYK